MRGHRSLDARGTAPARCAALAALACLAWAGCAGSSSKPHKVDGPLQHYQLARMYYEQGKVPEALKEIERSLALDASLPQVHFYAGFIYLNQEHWSEAAQRFRDALAINPYYTDARMYLSTCLNELGRPDEAISQLQEALKDRTYPNPEKIYLNLAVIHRQRGQIEQALAMLRQAVQRQPRYYRGHYEMAGVLEELRHSDEALLAYESAAPGYLADAEFHYRYGAALLRHDRKAEGARELRRAIELSPGSETAAQASQLLKSAG